MLGHHRISPLPISLQGLGLGAEARTALITGDISMWVIGAHHWITTSWTRTATAASTDITTAAEVY